jgi:GAF domain-containing protein
VLTTNSELSALFEGERNFIANASNFCAYFFHEYENINWFGFYFFDGKELVLGPFQGKAACIRIALGSGVCGNAALHRKTIVVDNVHDFPGHIPCDVASNSEIVIPLVYRNELLGVLDVDSPVLNRFSDKDKDLLESALDILIKSSDIYTLVKYYQ